MDDQKYIECILILKKFFQTNAYPTEIIRIIIMSIYKDIQIGFSGYTQYLFIYDRMFPYLVYVRKCDKSSTFQQLRFDEPVKSIACGIEHTVCLTEKGNVYSWGKNYHGQLGLADHVNKYSPQKVKLENISVINCGPHYTIAYGNGILYMWGISLIYLSLREGDMSYDEPSIISYFQKDMVQISCGTFHVMYLFNDYDIFGWGDNTFKQLGIDRGKSIKEPIEITFFKENNIKVISIKCGETHTMFLTSENKIYVCGTNEHGQLGLDSKCNLVQQLQKLNQNFGDIKEIDCAGYYSAILTTTKKLYICGSNAHGPLGIYKQIVGNHQHSFQEFKYVTNIKKIKCGFSRTIIIRDDDTIYILDEHDISEPDSDAKNYPRELSLY